MKFCLLVIFLLGISQTKATIIDILATTNGHEPSVAVNCGKVPFYMDLETGAWVADSRGVALCDSNKEDVKKFCQETYKNLNISNIVEANQPLKFTNWCEPGLAKCVEEDTVEPYRCLGMQYIPNKTSEKDLSRKESIVSHYNLDALEVGRHCQKEILNGTFAREDLAVVAEKQCQRKRGMKLKSYGTLLACDRKQYSVVVVCCLNETFTFSPKNLSSANLNTAIKDFMSFTKIPEDFSFECKSPDKFRREKLLLNEDHMFKMSNLLDNWYITERSLSNQQNATSSINALKRLKESYRNLRGKFYTLEENYKYMWSQTIINDNTCFMEASAQKVLNNIFKYIRALRKKPTDIERIVTALNDVLEMIGRNHLENSYFFQCICRYDDSSSEYFVENFERLNLLVHKGLRLLNHLPDIVDEFGFIDGGMLKLHVDIPPLHTHTLINEIFHKIKKQYGFEDVEVVKDFKETSNATYDLDGIIFVQDGCTSHHYINNTMCLQKESLKETLQVKCGRNKIVDSYGMLASCAPDQYLGAWFVCCLNPDQPRKSGGSYAETLFYVAIEGLLELMTPQAKDCDRSAYKQKISDNKSQHSATMQRLYDEWKMVEKRYKTSRANGDENADEKLKESLAIMESLISDLEEQFKDSKETLSLEHPECYKEDLAYKKLNAMQGYVRTLKETPMDVEAVYVDLQNVINVCQDDKVRSLRHFVRNRDEANAGSLRVELLQQLNDLNKVVDESIMLLSFFPRTADQLNVWYGMKTILTHAPETVRNEPHSDKKIVDMIERVKRRHPFLADVN